LIICYLEVDFRSSEKFGQTLETAQLPVGGVLIGLLGIALLWKGSKVKGTLKH
jgi:hypothetical protein